MRMCRILLIALQLVLPIHGLGMSQEMDVFATLKIDSVVDAKVQQNLDNKLELYFDKANRAYQKHDNEMKDWYMGLGSLIAIFCLAVTVAGIFYPYIFNKKIEKHYKNKEKEINEHISRLREEINQTNNQTQAMVLYMLAREKKNLDKKIELCKKAVEYNPKYYLGQKLLGASYFRLKDLSNAIKSYSLALNIECDDDIYIARALAYSEDGQDGNAIADYNRAIAVNPNNDKAYYNKAFKLFRMDKAEEAGPIIEKAKNLKREPKYYELSCLINEKIGNKVAALKDAEIGLNIIQQERKTLAEFFIKKIDELKGKL